MESHFSQLTVLGINAHRYLIGSHEPESFNFLAAFCKADDIIRFIQFYVQRYLIREIENVMLIIQILDHNEGRRQLSDVRFAGHLAARQSFRPAGRIPS
jgi:hypothetical protein